MNKYLAEQARRDASTRATLAIVVEQSHHALDVLSRARTSRLARAKDSNVHDMNEMRRKLTGVREFTIQDYREGKAKTSIPPCGTPSLHNLNVCRCQRG